MEEDDPQRFVSSGGRSHQSSPSQSPRMGLMMTRGESQGSGASGASGASPSLKRRASIVAAKSFKSDRESEKKQVEARRFFERWLLRKVFCVLFFFWGSDANPMLKMFPFEWVENMKKPQEPASKSNYEIF